MTSQDVKHFFQLDQFENRYFAGDVQPAEIDFDETVRTVDAAALAKEAIMVVPGGRGWCAQPRIHRISTFEQVIQDMQQREKTFRLLSWEAVAHEQLSFAYFMRYVANMLEEQMQHQCARSNKDGSFSLGHMSISSLKYMYLKASHMTTAQRFYTRAAEVHARPCRKQFFEMRFCNNDGNIIPMWDQYPCWYAVEYYEPGNDVWIYCSLTKVAFIYDFLTQTLRCKFAFKAQRRHDAGHVIGVNLTQILHSYNYPTILLQRYLVHTCYQIENQNHK
jgi:hypothetical protein